MAEEMIYIPMRYCVDLDKTINTTPLNTLFAMGDAQAHRFELTITHGSVAEDLTGCTVKGKFVSFSNNMTVNLTGSVTGGNAVVTLTQACYSQLGRFALVIQIVKGSIKTSVFYGDGYMRSTTTDNAIDGNYIVYDINAMLSKIQEIENAISAANDATSSANAAASSANAWANATAMATALAAGSAPTVSVGTSGGNKVLKLGIPKGDRGDKGEKGDKGDTGETGPTGKSGVAVSETEPTDSEITVWVKEDGSEDMALDATTLGGRGPDDYASAEAVGQLKDEIAAETRRAKEAEDNRIKKFYTSNLGATSIADSDDGAVRNLVIGGKSEQKQYSGKNLLNATMSSITTGGISCIRENGIFTLNGTASETVFLKVSNNVSSLDQKKKIVGCPPGGANDTYSLRGRGSEDYIDIGNGVTMNESAPLNDVVIVVKKGTVCDNLVFKPMLTLDLSATYNDFEPYTGGNPSPSPDYPQEIKSVEGCTMTVSSADGTKMKEAAIPVTLRGIGDVRDELIVYADRTGKLVRRYPETLDQTRTVAEQALEIPVETLLTADQVRALYDLRTHYGGTNITFDSDNGIDPTVNFDYACALNAFVEYIKTQQGDTREMIYDMEDRLTQAEVAALEAAIDTQIMAAMMEV